MSRPSHARAVEWLTPALLILLGLVPAGAGVARVADLASGAAVTPANARFVAQPLPVVLHVMAVIPFSLVGAFQFASGLRRRHRAWHRAAGRAVAACGLAAAVTGLWMTLVYPWPDGDGAALYLLRLAFGTGMLASIVLAIRAVLRRDFASHGVWMIRGYAIGMGAGTQVLTHLPWLLLADGRPGESARAIMMGAGWGLNVVVAEWIIRRAQARTTGAVPFATSRAPATP